MFCKYCGEKIDDDSIFCEICGKRLVAENLTQKNNGQSAYFLIRKKENVNDIFEPLEEEKPIEQPTKPIQSNHTQTKTFPKFFKLPFIICTLVLSSILILATITSELSTSTSKQMETAVAQKTDSDNLDSRDYITPIENLNTFNFDNKTCFHTSFTDSESNQIPVECFYLNASQFQSLWEKLPETIIYKNKQCTPWESVIYTISDYVESLQVLIRRYNAVLYEWTDEENGFTYINTFLINHSTKEVMFFICSFI